MPDFDFITERLAVGGSLYTRENFEEVLRAGITHIINTQMDFDDRTLRLPAGAGRAENHEPDILWLPVDDDLLPKPAEFFFAAVRYSLDALTKPGTKILIHCSSGIHRGPMLAFALLCVLGYHRADALALLHERRPQVHFPPVYLDSVDAFLAEWHTQ